MGGGGGLMFFPSSGMFGEIGGPGLYHRAHATCTVYMFSPGSILLSGEQNTQRPFRRVICERSACSLRVGAAVERNQSRHIARTWRGKGRSLAGKGARVVVPIFFSFFFFLPFFLSFFLSGCVEMSAQLMLIRQSEILPPVHFLF